MLRKVSILLVLVLVLVPLVAMVVMMMGTLEQLTGASNNEAIVQLERVRILYTTHKKYCKCFSIASIVEIQMRPNSVNIGSQHLHTTALPPLSEISHP